MKRTLLFFLAALLLGTATAATGTKTYKFWVSFRDKSGTPYSILKPWDFLSQKALDRRKRAGKPVGMEDLPVVPAYVIAVSGTGVQVLLSSRWMNAVLVTTRDSSRAVELSRMTMVQKVELMGIWSYRGGAAELNPDAFEHFGLKETETVQDTCRIAVKTKKLNGNDNNGYGLAWDQINQLNGYELHKRGYRGKGILIAVLDAGFYRANQMEAFDSLMLSHRVLGTKDFVDFDNSVYNDDDHGTQVLSCMAANVPGLMVGTAPDASYLLLRTEDHRSEFPSEEAQWVAGVEMADSAGADIVNSSLGYTVFDRPELGHRYAELTGNTTLISRAANMAWERGIIMVNSAGNEGDGDWHYIGAPADAPGVIAVAAVDRTGRRADFSSMGPTADGRMKPDLAAMGENTIVAGTSGYFTGASGTSFSSPVLCGMIASFMQYAGTVSPQAMRQAVELSARHSLGKDSLLGGGLPDFRLAMDLVKGTNTRKEITFVQGLPSDTMHTAFNISTLQSPAKTWFYTLQDAEGKTVSQGSLSLQGGLMYAAAIEPAGKGIYTLTLKEGAREWKKTFYFEPYEWYD
ncbi:MAG: S8 family serine peptidase [Bacteroidetes bacterium]|nr:S8 family serine peptidase [Bacteroidota bacterium]